MTPEQESFIREVLAKLEILRDEIYGCGNGRIKVDMYIKQLRRDYGVYN